MIGHYLLSLTPKEENYVLTKKMGPITGNGDLQAFSNTCLLMAANSDDYPVVNQLDFQDLALKMDKWRAYWRDNTATHIGVQYDKLCERFGTKRVNDLIRNRVLANQARRALTPMRQEATV